MGAAANLMTGPWSSDNTMITSGQNTSSTVVVASNEIPIIAKDDSDSATLQYFLFRLIDKYHLTSFVTLVQVFELYIYVLKK